MPDLYFNPYPGAALDFETGKNLLLRAAASVKILTAHIDNTFDPVDLDSISAFYLVRENNGNEHILSNVVHSLRGEERDLALNFLLIFSKGQKLTEADLDGYETLLLASLGTPAPVLEFALMHQGITTSLATAQEWAVNFLEFQNTAERLPNIYGQEDLTDIIKWISQNNIQKNGYLVEFCSKFNVTICDGALDINFFSTSEWDLIFKKMQEALDRNFEHDGYLVKDLNMTNKGQLKQIKQRGSGIRLYITIMEQCILFGGTYRKGKGGSEKREKIIQTKAIERASKRINDH